MVEAYRALRILDAANGFGQEILASSLLISGIGGADYFKEGIGNCLSGLTVDQLREILESYPPDMDKVYKDIMGRLSLPSVSEMDKAIADGHSEVIPYRRRISIPLLDEAANSEHSGVSKCLNTLADNLKRKACRVAE